MLHEKLNLPKCNLVYLIQSCFFSPVDQTRPVLPLVAIVACFVWDPHTDTGTIVVLWIYMAIAGSITFLFVSLLVFICFYLQNNIKYSTSACFALKNEVGYNNIVIYQEVYHLYQSTNVHVVYLYLYNVMIFSGDACY